MYSNWVWLSNMEGAVFITLVTSLLIWLGIVSFLLWRQGDFLKSLFPKKGERDIRKKIVEMLQEVDGFDKQLSEVREKLQDVEKDGLDHMQKVALLRYNPYNDTGGDQSFSLALLNQKGWGVVITSLHSRSESRIFAKPVADGKVAKYQFSKEEEDVVKKALGIK